MSAGNRSLPLAAARFCVTAVGTLALWTLWLGLALLLAVQIYIASADTLSVPGFVRRALEDRLAASGVHATFGRTYFDPTGQLFVEDATLTLPGFTEPLVTARGIVGRINPWALLADQFDPIELRVTGLSLRVPALLSLSGGADEIIQDVDAALIPRGNDLEIEYLTGRLGTMPVVLQGTLHLAPGSPAKGAPAPGGVARASGPAPLPITDALAQNYARLSRQCDAVLAQLAAFDQPLLQVQFLPTDGPAGLARVNFFARGYRRSGPVPGQLRAVHLSGDLPFGGAGPFPVEVAVTAAQGTFLSDGQVDNLSLWIDGQLNGTNSPSPIPTFQPQGVRVVADRLRAEGLTLERPAIQANLANLPRVAADVQGFLWGQPVGVRGEVDATVGAASAHFAGAVAPAILDYINLRTHHDLHPIIAYTTPISVEGDARFGPAWKFGGATAHVSLAGVTAQHVLIDAAQGDVAFDGRVLRTTNAFARLGDNSAGGSFTEDVVSHDYRFLLQGRVRPLDIAPWVAAGWWRDFFSMFEFPAEPVSASADLKGCFTDGRKAAVFIDLAVARPKFRGVTVDHLHARLFARPQYTEALDFQVQTGSGQAAGTFMRHYDLDAGALRSIDLSLNSTLDLGPIGPLLPTDAAAIVANFAFTQPPQVGFTGHFDGPAAVDAQHDVMHLEVRTGAPFRYGEFPFDGVVASADVTDGDVLVSPLTAQAAGGALTGRVRVWSAGNARRLGLSLALAHGSLGQAITAVQDYSARRAHRPITPPGRFVQDKANVRLDASMDAEGEFGDALSFQGTGTAALAGDQLGEIRMLGLLSELLPFTSLRFTAAHANFQIAGPRLIFPGLSVTGANSALTGSGTYLLDRSQLDFRVRVNPFKQSKSAPQKLMDVFLTPLATALEVRLTGNIDNPHWVFVNGLSNFIQNLAPQPGAAPAPALNPRSPLASPSGAVPGS